MQEAVTILKGVLGFTDQPLTSAPRVRIADDQEILRDTTRKRPPPPPPPARRSSSESVSDYQPLLKGRSNSNESNPSAAEANAAEEADLNLPRFRLWTFPAHIDDQEAASLAALFPKSLAQGRDSRLPLVRPGRGGRGGEEGTWKLIQVDGREVARTPEVDSEAQEGVLRQGTGRMWAGQEDREEGWQGSGWFRFIRWWKRLFGM